MSLIKKHKIKDWLFYLTTWTLSKEIELCLENIINKDIILYVPTQFNKKNKIIKWSETNYFDHDYDDYIEYSEKIDDDIKKYIEKFIKLLVFE